MKRFAEKVVMLVILSVLLLGLLNIGKGVYEIFVPPKSRASSQAGIRAEAAMACRDAVRDATVFGSKADFHFTTRRYGKSGGVLAVEEEVDLMNGLGLMIPHTYLCTYDQGRAKIISLRRGS